MYLTKSDSATIASLLTLIQSTLDGYSESPYDQIDTLRAKIAEVSDILTDESFDVGDEDDSFESLRTEQLGNLEEEFRYAQLN